MTVGFLVLAIVASSARAFFSDAQVYEDLDAGFDRTVIFLPDVADRAIGIDGKLDEQAWQTATTFGDFQQLESALPMPDEIATTGRILRSPQGLYVAIIGKRVSPPHDQPELADQGLDTIALQFNGNVNDFTRYRFGITGEGKTYTLRHFVVPAWNPEGWSAAYHATDETITAEFFVPYELFCDGVPGDGDRVAFNVMRYATQYLPVPGGPYYCSVHDTYAFRSALCHATSAVDHFPWLYFGTERQFRDTPQPPIARAYLDKVVYRPGDETAEAYVEVRGLRDYNLHVILDGREKQFTNLATGSVGFAFDVSSLKPGDHTLRALVVKDGKQLAVAERAFTVEGGSFQPVKLPEAVNLTLTDHADNGTGMRPISTAVPLPRGALRDGDLPDVRIERQLPTGEDPNRPWLGAWEPIPAQVEVRDRWSRGGSIRWLGVDFDAEYYRGRQKALHMPDHPYYPTYRVRFGEPRPVIENPLTVDETDDTITVDCGALRAVISKTNFQLLTEASLDGVKLIAAGAGDGLIHVDQDGRTLTAAHDATRVWVERAGPMAAVICAEGWYGSGDAREGKHFTRLFFRRGMPYVRVHHTYIVTVDTREKTIRNIATRLGVPGIEQFNLEDVTGKGSAHLLQQRHDEYVIERGGEQLASGDRASGALTVTTPRGKVQLATRRFWQTYPKELEVTPNSVALHTWPAHGREVFTDEEIAHPLGVAQALFAHHGKQLNLRVPDACYETMGNAYSQHLLDRGYDKTVGPPIAGFQFKYAWDAWHANAQGMAFTTEFAIRLYDADSEVDRDFPRILDADAHAIADPKWTHATGVFGELWPQDTQRFGAAERWIAQRHNEMMVDTTERLGDYGMINWPDIHTYPHSFFTGRFDAGWFHRTWTGTHYQEGRTFYLMYLRSGEHRYWQYARDSARLKMDVNTVNYSSLPRVDKNQTPFGSYHVYGMYGWAGMQGISCHYQNHDYKTWESFITGDPRGAAQAMGWAREMARSTWATESTRDAAVTLSEALEVYRNTRYAPLLKTVHWFKEAVVGVPIDQFILPHYSMMVWSRAHEYTRDPRVARRLVEQWDDGKQTKRNGLGSAHTLLTLYRITGDPRVLAMLSFGTPTGAMVPNMGPPRLTRTMMMYPYAMAGLAEVGATGDVLVDRNAYRTFWKPYFEKWKAEGKKLFGAEIQP